MANEVRVHGSGKIYISTVGDDPETNGFLLGDVQSVSLDVTYEQATIMNTPEISRFAVATAYHSGKAIMKISTENINREVLKRTCGGTLASAGGITTLTIGQTSGPTPFAITWVGKDSLNRDVKATLLNATAPGTSIQSALNAWTKSDFSPEGFPDSTGKVCTIQTPQAA